MERYFQTISAIGELFIEKILFEFDKEPIVFVCRNYKNGSVFMFMYRFDRKLFMDGNVCINRYIDRPAS